ncbi:hypothetical protein WJX84_007854 [Apatococcus fuscideae]|uniref:RTR1-type domain-containing protein n=1 Tax=Apatococcus fuscideae TaxID=2026836 RepID=A0AAW1T0I3_9CHLO
MVNRLPTPREQRRAAVLSAVCTLVEEPATLQGGLLTLLAPFTADELLEAAEERGLAGLCGNPTCSDDPFMGRKALSRLQGPRSSDPTVERLLDGVCCSEACALAVQRLAEGLGKEEQALLRWEVVRRREGLKGTPGRSHQQGKTKGSEARLCSWDAAVPNHAGGYQGAGPNHESSSFFIRSPFL